MAVPVSLLGTFGVMYLFGYSVDNLSLMALTICTGFVVDDAIVVIENITRRRPNSECAPWRPRSTGAQEIGFTVLSMTLSLVAVFIPILMMGGIVGRLFREFAITLSVAILVSLLVSLTMTPMMCSRLLKREHGQEHGRIYRINENAFSASVRIYDRGLKWVFGHEALTMGVLAITIAVNIYLLIIVPKGFFPLGDTGHLRGGIRGSQAFLSGDARNRFPFSSIIKTDPAVATAVSFTGGNSPLNTGSLNVTLKPIDQRKLDASQVIDRLRPKLNSIPGARGILSAGQSLRIGGRSSNAQYQYTLRSDSVDDLVQWGPIVFEEMKKLRELTDVDSDQQNSGLEARLVYDRQTAARLGITPQLLDTTLYGAFGQSQVSTMYTSLNQYHVVMEVAPKFWQDPRGLNYVYIHSPTGKVVPLSAVAHFEKRIAPLAVNHDGQFPAVTISFNLAPGVALSDAVAAISQAEQNVSMPSTIRSMYAGSMQAFRIR